MLKVCRSRNRDVVTLRYVAVTSQQELNCSRSHSSSSTRLRRPCTGAGITQPDRPKHRGLGLGYVIYTICTPLHRSTYRCAGVEAAICSGLANRAYGAHVARRNVDRSPTRSERAVAQRDLVRLTFLRDLIDSRRHRGLDFWKLRESRCAWP